MRSLLRLAETAQDILWEGSPDEPLGGLESILSSAMVEWKMFFDLLHEGIQL